MLSVALTPPDPCPSSLGSLFRVVLVTSSESLRIPPPPVCSPVTFPDHRVQDDGVRSTRLPRSGIHGFYRGSENRPDSGTGPKFLRAHTPNPTSGLSVRVLRRGVPGPSSLPVSPGSHLCLELDDLECEPTRRTEDSKVPGPPVSHGTGFRDGVRGLPRDHSTGPGLSLPSRSPYSVRHPTPRKGPHTDSHSRGPRSSLGRVHHGRSTPRPVQTSQRFLSLPPQFLEGTRVDGRGVKTFHPYLSQRQGLSGMVQGGREPGRFVPNRHRNRVTGTKNLRLTGLGPPSGLDVRRDLYERSLPLPPRGPKPLHPSDCVHTRTLTRKVPSTPDIPLTVDPSRRSLSRHLCHETPVPKRTQGG